MSDFLTAYKKAIAWEGFYSNDPADPGGETYMGITRKNYPNCKIWLLVEREKPLKQNEKLKATEADRIVQDFYQQQVWNRQPFGAINSQSVSNLLFDWYINSGVRAIECVQKMLGIEADGIIGTRQTLPALNGPDPNLLDKLKACRIAFYKSIVNRQPTQARYLTGWINRVNSFV